jgi:hypothetical protein
MAGQGRDSYAPPVNTVTVPLLWLCGPTGVGKSVVGWEVFEQVRRDGVKAAYVDLRQVGFFRPPADGGDLFNHRLKSRNVGAMWRTFRAAGARCLILSGGIDHHGTRGIVRMYASAVPRAKPTLCRLRAGPEALTERILARGRGRGPALPGDELKGQSVETLLLLAEEAVRDGQELERAGVGDLCVDTDGRSAAEVAEVVRARARARAGAGAGAGGWPGL